MNFEFKMASLGNVVFIDRRIKDVAFLISLTHKNFSSALLLPIPASSLFYGLFNLEMTMVSVLHRELGYKVEKLKYRKVGGHAAGDQNQIQISSW